MGILAAFAVVIGTLICLANWYALIVTASGRRQVSVAPLVGAACLFLGLRGFRAAELWAWLSPLADWGTLSPVIALPQLYRQAHETSLRDSAVQVYELTDHGVLVKATSEDPGHPMSSTPPDCFGLKLGALVRGSCGEGVVIGAQCSPRRADAIPR